MAKHTPVDKEHDDGSWFLEAVGAKDRAPSPIESVAELERENTLVDTPVVGKDDPDSQVPNDVPIELTSFSGDPGTSLSTFDPIPEPPPLPPNVITANGSSHHVPSPPLPPPIDSTDDIDDSILPRALQTRRPFRWPAIGAGVLVLAIIGIAFLWLPRAADASALARKQAYQEASIDVRRYLPTAQASLDVLTKPSSSEEALGTVIPSVSELSSHTANLATVASEPLPSTLPLVPSDAIDALAPLKDKSAILASDTAEIARQIGHGYVYRTSIPQLLDVGALPSAATTDEINTLSVSLASSLAENASLVADLPANEAFDAVKAHASDAMASYSTWQDDYLSALADGNGSVATELIADIDMIRADLLAETELGLLTFRELMDDRIVVLAGEFDQHLSDLSQ